ncbi:MAG: transporter substrate-binding domain-containing protein [Actinomycetota bacterium]|nr:transporter substrate-binding domain-containing protein [Actinomycetota bacterium]MDH5312965.1 transporter substrate-binding domain-containing protein [Actinomycetota bacterium]
MPKFRFRSILVLTAALSLVAAACGSDEPADTAAGGNDTGSATAETACSTADTSAGDLLAEICSNGVIRVSTDPAYPPQSSLNPETGEYEGFDIDVATAIAERLGVEIEWETPSWTAITSGNWNGRWDMSVGSMTVTAERAEVLDFTPAYYFTPASIAVPEGSDITSVDQLNGKTIGVCSGCTYDFFLQNTLDIPGYTFESPITDPVIKGFDTDSTAIQALQAGQVDAVMSATPTLQSAIDKGRPMQLLGDPLFSEPLSVAIDKASDLDQASLVAAVSSIVEEMHADGTLSALSAEWYDGQDLTIDASAA